MTVRELEDIEIKAVALVDEPAVPKATIILMKRDDEAQKADQQPQPENKQEGSQPTEDEKQDAVSKVKAILESVLSDVPDSVKGKIKEAISALESLSAKYPPPYGYAYSGMHKRGRILSKENEERLRAALKNIEEIISQLEEVDGKQEDKGKKEEKDNKPQGVKKQDDEPEDEELNKLIAQITKDINDTVAILTGGVKR